ncbi:MAG: CopG family transcriptional regulator [Verrucomicrobiota bacterium]
MKKQSTMTAQEFERRFDEGEDVTPFIDMASIRRPGVEPRRVNVDFPEWMIAELDWQSRLIGVSRQALVKLWVSERIQKEQQIQKRLLPSGSA